MLVTVRGSHLLLVTNKINSKQNLEVLFKVNDTLKRVFNDKMPLFYSIAYIRQKQLRLSLMTICHYFMVVLQPDKN